MFLSFSVFGIDPIFRGQESGGAIKTAADTVAALHDCRKRSSFACSADGGSRILLRLRRASAVSPVQTPLTCPLTSSSSTCSPQTSEDGGVSVLELVRKLDL